MKKTSTNNNYVDKKQLLQELIVYQKHKKKSGGNAIPSDYIGKAIMLICDGLSTRPNFVGYTFRTEMISDGIEDCVAAIKNFDPNKSKNPYGYFTQIAWWAFVQRILIEQKQQYLKHKNYQNNFMLSDLSNSENNTAEKTQRSVLSDQVIEKFENNLTKNKKSGKIGTKKSKTKDKGNVFTKKSTSNTPNRSIPRGSPAKRRK